MDEVFCIHSLGADSEEKHEPVSDIDSVPVDSLIARDTNRPIREADNSRLESRLYAFHNLACTQAVYTSDTIRR